MALFGHTKISGKKVAEKGKIIIYEKAKLCFLKKYVFTICYYDSIIMSENIRIQYQISKK